MKVAYGLPSPNVRNQTLLYSPINSPQSRLSTANPYE
jgi:hypothetical protein